jgi:hypothetical protein
LTPLGLERNDRAHSKFDRIGAPSLDRSLPQEIAIESLAWGWTEGLTTVV